MLTRSLTLAVCAVAVALSQSPDSLRGHWTGAIEIPNAGPMTILVDLDKTDKGWIGSMAIPTQNAAGLALSDIRSSEGKWSFRLQGPPGDPAFSGKLSADGKTFSGDFTQGGGTIAFKLTHTGEPKVEVAKAMPAVAKEFTGDWEGTLEGPGLRLKLNIANEAGAARGTLVSVDQGGARMPVSAIEQKDAKLVLRVRAVGGEYQGEINKDGSEMQGEWSQAGNSLPLQWKKVNAVKTDK